MFCSISCIIDTTCFAPLQGRVIGSCFIVYSKAAFHKEPVRGREVLVSYPVSHVGWRRFRIRCEAPHDRVYVLINKVLWWVSEGGNTLRSPCQDGERESGSARTGRYVVRRCLYIKGEVLRAMLIDLIFLCCD